MYGGDMDDFLLRAYPLCAKLQTALVMSIYITTTDIYLITLAGLWSVSLGCLSVSTFGTL